MSTYESESTEYEPESDLGFGLIYTVGVVALVIAGVLQIYRNARKEREQEEQQVETTAVNIQIPSGNAAAVSNGTRRANTKQTTSAVTTTPITVSNQSSFPNDGPKKTSRWFSPVN